MAYHVSTAPVAVTLRQYCLINSTALNFTTAPSFRAARQAYLSFGINMSAKVPSLNNPSMPSRRLNQNRWSLSAFSSIDSISTVLSSQPKLRKTRHSVYEKVDAVLTAMKIFDSLGEFLSVLFYCHPKRTEKADLRTARHVSVVSAFLQDTSAIHMGHIIDLIYSHCQSQPKQSSRHASKIYLAFSPNLSPIDIHHAHHAMSSWAAKPQQTAEQRMFVSQPGRITESSAWRKLARSIKECPDEPE